MHRIVLPDLHHNMRTLDAEMTKAEARLSSLQSYMSVLKEAQPREGEQDVNAGTDWVWVSRQHGARVLRAAGHDAQNLYLAGQPVLWPGKHAVYV